MILFMQINTFEMNFKMVFYSEIVLVAEKPALRIERRV